MPRSRKYVDGAARMAAYRARNELVSFTVQLPQDVVEGLREWMKFKDLTQSQVVERLIRGQLLRKR